MKITLISPFSEISSIGVRTLSSYLKSNGISTRLIFLPMQKSYYSREDFISYSDYVIDNLAELIKSDDLIGISVMSNYYDAIKDLTLKLKRKLPNIPIIWGGIHTTVKPEDCVAVADYICIGEGELPFLELCQMMQSGNSVDNIPGIRSGTSYSALNSAPGKIIMDLDQIPPPDYDFEENYICSSSHELIPITNKNVKKFLGVTYWTLYTRGCPFHCTYCCNNALRKINRNLTKLRAKSPENIVQEINVIIERLPFIEYIYFTDDTMFALPEKDIREFSQYYKKFIGLPFIVSGIQPSVFTEKKFDDLVDCGMIRVRMGIQTGSQRILNMYERKQTNETVVRVTSLLQKHSDKLMMPNYDIILDNPWEKQEDKLDTIALLSKIAHPFCLNLFSLVFFPGTSLYDKAVRERIVHEETKYKHYLDYEPSYLNFIVALFCLFKVPCWLLELLLSKQLVNTKRNLLTLHRILYYLILFRRGMYSIYKRDFSMFPPVLQVFFCRILPRRTKKKAEKR